MHSAHAALSPWEGKNALDAAVLAYSSIGLLRQQTRPTYRIHGIFEGEDWAPNSQYPTSSRENSTVTACSHSGQGYDAVMSSYLSLLLLLICPTLKLVRTGSYDEGSLGDIRPC